jgi:hypothetical protein
LPQESGPRVALDAGTLSVEAFLAVPVGQLTRHLTALVSRDLSLHNDVVKALPKVRHVPPLASRGRCLVVTADSAISSLDSTVTRMVTKTNATVTLATSPGGC